MTCHGCQSRPVTPGSHYCHTCEHAWRTGAAVIGGAAVLPMAILDPLDPGAVAGQLDLAHALNEGDTAMIDNAPHRALRAAVTGRIESGDATPITEERRTGTDRRAPVPSPVGDRWRNVADSLDAIGNTNADHADNPDTFLRGYATGQADAYAAAAAIVRALADAEDSR